MNKENNVAEVIYEDTSIEPENSEKIFDIISNNKVENLQNNINHITKNNPNNKKNIISIIELISLCVDSIKKSYRLSENKIIFTFNNENLYKIDIIICLEFLMSKIENVLLKIKNVDIDNKNSLLELYSDLIQLINIIDPKKNVKFENKYINEYDTYLKSIKKTNDGIGNYYENKENFDIKNEMKKIYEITHQTTIENPLNSKPKPTTSLSTSSLNTMQPRVTKGTNTMSLSNEKSNEEMIGGKRNKTMKKCMKKPRKQRKTNKKNVKKSRKTKRSIRR
jgi:hypothetical protein